MSACGRLAWPRALGLSGALSLAASCAGSALPAHAPAAPEAPREHATRTLAKREELPLEVREMLTGRMLRHGQEMTELMVGVLLLDYELAELMAQNFADEPKLLRPRPSERGTLNALLPPSYFVHQDALSLSSRALATAARARDDQRLVEAFGQLAATCVSCHSAYLHDDLVELTHVEPGEPLSERSPP